MMTDLLRDLRSGARGMAAAPGFAAIVILVVALCVGANSAIFSVVNAVLLRPLPYRDPGRLFQIDEMDPDRDAAGVSPADALVFRARSSAFESIGLFHWQNLTLTGPEGPENIYGAKVSNDCFSTLGSTPALGRMFTPEEFHPGAPGVVVLSDRLWARRYDRRRDVIGSALMMNGQAFTIVGVMPPEFFLNQRFGVWIPWQFSGEDRSQRDTRASAIARLKRAADPKRAESEALAILRDVAPQDVRKGWGIRITPLARQITERVRPALLVSFGAVAFVLLIGCINVANLLLARGSRRTREIAIRIALGAGRWRVARQLLTESVLMAACGGAAGLGLGAWAVKGLIAILPEAIGVPRLDQTRVDARVLLFSLGLSIATGLLFGIIPAIQASRGNLSGALKAGGGRGPTQSRRTANVLVILETALSLVLLAGAGLMLRSFQRLMATDPGFQPDRVLTMRVPLPSAITGKKQQPAYYTRILERIESLPGIVAAGFIAPLPLANVGANATFAVRGAAPSRGRTQYVHLRCVTPGYFRAMGIGLRRGRVFDASDSDSAPPVVVINESLARKYFPGRDPVGNEVTMDSEGKGDYMVVIGVVNDVKDLEMSAGFEPEMYRDYRQFLFAPFSMTLAIRASGTGPERLAGTVQKQIRDINPDQPVGDVKTMERVVSDNVAQPRFYTLLLAVYAGIALVLAAAGLYGVLSSSVGQRVREIGIRAALGASRLKIAWLVVGGSLALVSSGLVLGIGGSLALTRLLRSQLYQTAPTDPATLAAVSIVLLGVAALASYVPVRLALSVDPVEALRSE
jgi:putative ABC transport system permease protein